jgi:hypothetical protein
MTALEGRSALREVARGLVGDPPAIPLERWWNTRWILIFGTGGLPKLALDCSGGPAEPSPVRLIEWDGIGSSRYGRALAGSLGEYVENGIRRLREGRRRYDALRDTWLPVDAAGNATV